MNALQNVLDGALQTPAATIAICEALVLMWVNICRLGALTRASRPEAALGQLGLFGIPIVFLVFGAALPLLENKLDDNPYAELIVPAWAAWMLGFQLFGQLMLSYRWKRTSPCATMGERAMDTGTEVQYDRRRTDHILL